MSHFLRQGFQIMKSHFKIVLLLFMYHALWGFILYRTVNHIVTPILKRYPDLTGRSDAVTLFWMESQFQLLKTDMIMPYVYTFLIMLFIRMLITPFLQAGLLHSIHQHANQGSGTFFLQGIKKKWKKVTLLYWLKSLAILIPLGMFVQPIISKLLHTNGNGTFLSQNTSWNLLFLILWSLLIQVVFYILQLGAAWEIKMLTMLKKACIHALAFCSVTIVISLLYVTLSTGVHLLSLLWVSLISFIMYQSLPLLRTLMDVWLIASQYKVIHSK